MLISLHLPKTAGTSFFTSLEEYYGDRILRDYNDRPIRTPREERNSAALRQRVLNQSKDFGHIACVHGHFLPFKYSLCEGARFVTWIRDPLERLGSHYFYWKRNYHPGMAHRAAPLRKKMRRRELAIRTLLSIARTKERIFSVSMAVSDRTIRLYRYYRALSVRNAVLFPDIF